MSESHECPTCGDEFDTQRGMKIHHNRSHGESIAGELCVCDYCGCEYREEEWKLERNEDCFCSRGCWISSKEGDYEDNLHSEVLDKSDVKDAILDLSDELGRPPTKDEMRESGRYSPNTARRRFGSWGNALGACGLWPWRDPNRLERKYVDDELCISEIADEFGCSTATVHTALVNNGIETRDKNCYDQPTGADHPSWKGGKYQYFGPNWSSQRRKALERDDYQCQRCGVSEQEHLDVHGVSLDIHHLEPRRKYKNGDGTLDFEKANRLGNLVALCRSCHRRWEGIPLRPQTASD